ncbi:hypothetical protein DY000_02053105 [Brassica cretica]|uniref:Uncharacterized protein n=1 Tax=Brassica cretica TaxID=69181 RepID=A0ABQ7AHH5_BRACR|nr:hypothetical protein DY000_02053105 [Brassica cretica]
MVMFHPCLGAFRLVVWTSSFHVQDTVLIMDNLPSWLIFYGARPIIWSYDSYGKLQGLIVSLLIFLVDFQGAFHLFEDL